MANATKPRERILQVADELFYALGIHAVGVDEIIARSGAAKSTLYAHFPSKDDLIASYLQRRSDNWRRYMEEALADCLGSPRERIDTVFDVLVHACADPGFRGCPFINLAAEYPNPAHPARVVAAAHREWVRRLLVSLAVDVAEPDPEALADQLVLLYDAAMIGAKFEPSGMAPARAREAARTLVAAALESRQTETG